MDAQLCKDKCCDCEKPRHSESPFYRLYGRYYCEPCFIYQTRFKRYFIFTCCVCGLFKVHDGKVSYIDDSSPVCSTKCAMQWFIQQELVRMTQAVSLQEEEEGLQIPIRKTRLGTSL